MRRRTLRRHQRVESIESISVEHVQAPLRENLGVMITPNHSAHYDWAALYAVADEIELQLYVLTAWQVFGMSHPIQHRLIQLIGCFSIDREGTDQRAFKQAVKILQLETHPLAILIMLTIGSRIFGTAPRCRAV